MMKKPILCFDVDGTLRDNVNHQVSASTKKALQLLKKKGYKLLITSGRGVDSLRRTGLMDMEEWDGFVCNNGQTVLNKNQDILYQSFFQDQTVKETLKVAKELGYAVVLKSDPRIITQESDEYVLESQRFFKSVIPEIGTYHGQDVSAMIVYGPKHYDYAPFFKIKGLKVLPGESTYADLTIEGVTKATGIQKLMSLYDIDEYIAFGDSLNDMDMFKEASLSIAMGQGNEQLKAIASYVTSSIDEDGIYQACVHFHLI